jgi:5'(3')-deoxyribonucleotidase
VSNPNDVFLMDMDGILFDLHKKVAARLTILLGCEVTVGDCRNNSPVKGFAHLSYENTFARVYVKTMLAEPGFYRDLEPLPDAVWAVGQIREMGLRPVIVSSLGDVPACAFDKAASLDEHFKGLIHPRDYMFTSCKDLTRGAYYIDDGAEYLKTWKMNNAEGTTFTLARPYTQEDDADRFCESWQHVIAQLRAKVEGRIPGYV